MTAETRNLVQYRMDRARECLEEAKILIAEGHASTFVNRLYYACFYAVTAALLCRDLSSSKHSGVRALFHRHLAKEGTVSEAQAKLYDRLFDNRQRADYMDLVAFDKDEVAPWLDEARGFVLTIENLLS